MCVATAASSGKLIAEWVCSIRQACFKREAGTQSFSRTSQACRSRSARFKTQALLLSLLPQSQQRGRPSTAHQHFSVGSEAKILSPPCCHRDSRRVPRLWRSVLEMEWNGYLCQPFVVGSESRPRSAASQRLPLEGQAEIPTRARIGERLWAAGVCREGDISRLLR